MSEEARPLITPQVFPGEGPTLARRASKLFYSLYRTRTGLLGLIVLLLVFFAALGADQVAPYDPNKQLLTDRLIPPAFSDGGTLEHPLGTDHLGRDILSRIIHGARISLIVGLTSVALAGTLGCVLGLLAGFYGSWIDMLIMRLVDIQLAFPLIVLAIGIVAAIGGGLLNVILVIGISTWMIYARVVRGQVLSVKEKEYITAARAIGVRTPSVLFRHIFPNVFSPIIVLATYAVAQAIIVEASLTFLGVGVDPRTPSWGGMVSDGRNHIYSSWWLATLPGIAITLTVLAINLVGEWLRDVLDPRLRNP